MTLKRAILKALQNVDPYLHPLEALAVDVDCLLSEPPTVSELKAALTGLEVTGDIVAVRDRINETTKYRLSDQGKANLMAARA